MGNPVDFSTSLTLLRLLCAPDRDELAWRGFCDRYQPLIDRWCRRWLRQTADVEDVTQNVLGRVFTKIHTYDPNRGGFRGWLKTVVENAVKDVLRGQRRRPGDRGTGDSDIAKMLQAVAQPETIDVLAQDLDSNLRRDLDAILARVEQEVEPVTMRAFRLTALEGRPIAEVATELGKSYAAVCMAVNRVKKKLRAEGARLNEQGEKEPS
ncbi:MAG TPA: sigma-70 family RNA polymerase sigma factor [Gemmataceae bacterium]|jgi:RNA polymerase sigma factor (sigma-70 family)|nr:sigma-70 family RNA polymerase sigma factor [Gemmataceae bacterium]